MEVSEDWISHKMESLHVYDDFSFHHLFAVYLYVSNISTSLSIRHCHPGRSKMVTNIGQKSFYTLWQFSKTFCSHWRNYKHKYRDSNTQRLSVLTSEKCPSENPCHPGRSISKPKAFQAPMKWLFSAQLKRSMVYHQPRNWLSGLLRYQQHTEDNIESCNWSRKGGSQISHCRCHQQSEISAMSPKSPIWVLQSRMVIMATLQSHGTALLRWNIFDNMV